MTSKQLRPLDTIAAPGADNLRSINGIGPAVERRLNDAGIRTFVQLAALSPDEIATAVANVAGLSAKRIAEQDWISQARALDQALTIQPQETGTPTGGQRHEAFTVHLVLNDDNGVHHTRVEHIRGGEKETWAGWHADRLAGFIVDHATLRLTPAEPMLALAATDDYAAPLSAPPQRTSILRLRDLATLPAGDQEARGSFGYGEAFGVRLTLDLTEVSAAVEARLDYTAVVYAKKLDGGPRQIVGEATGTILLADQISLSVTGAALARGMYRLEAAVTLKPASGQSAPRPEVMAWLEGDLLQIY